MLFLPSALVLFIFFVLARPEYLEAPVCKHGDTALYSHYLINTNDLFRDLSTSEFMQRTINDICIGVGSDELDARCTCDGQTSKPACFGDQAWTPDRFHSIIKDLCEEGCLCTPRHYDDFTDDEMESLGAASDIGLLDPLKKKKISVLESVARYVKGKCRLRCIGPKKCNRSGKKCGDGPTVCKVYRTETGIFSGSGLCAPSAMHVFSDSAYEDLRPRDGDIQRFFVESCACNQTYVSHACCESQDGLVWEEPHLRLGVLEEEL